MQNYTIPDDAFSQELVRIRGLIGSGKLQDAALALNQAQHKAPQPASNLVPDSNSLAPQQTQW